MDDRDKKIQELEQSLARRARWFDRLQTQFRDLTLEANDLRQQVANLTKERDSILGDVTKLKAQVDELSAKLPQNTGIIIP